MDNETTSAAGSSPVERPVRRVRINAGAAIMQDHGFTRWPMTAGGPADPETEFTAEWNGRYWDCRADGYGARTWAGEPGRYGNGSIFVHNADGVTFADLDEFSA